MEIFEWNENIPVTANNLNEMQNIINNNILDVYSDVYSTEETKTNKIWIDGKPIYRKVITFTNTSTNWEVIGTINNMNLMIGIRGTVYDGGNNITAIPSFGTENVQIYVTSSGTINKKSTSYYQNRTGILILEYTKTIN